MEVPHTRRDEEKIIEYVSGLASSEGRRWAARVPKEALVKSLQALSGCQRCAFVEQVLAVFAPDILAGRGLEQRSGGATASAACSLDSDLHERLGDTSGSQGRVSAVDKAQQSTGNAVLPPGQLLALLSRNSGPEDLVGLLQFAWKGPAPSQLPGARESDGGPVDAGSALSAGAATSAPGDSRGGGVSAQGSHSSSAGRAGSGGPAEEEFLFLSDTLLGRARLLRRFLTQSVSAMQALQEEVGDCRRHAGCPGPAELAATLARLDSQHAHTLERLAAWGVLREPPATEAPAQGPEAPGAPGPLAQLVHGSGGAELPVAAASPSAGRRAGQRRQRRSEGASPSFAGRCPGHAMSRGVQASADAVGDGLSDSEEQDEDPELQLAIRLSLLEGTSASASGSGPEQLGTRVAAAGTAGDVAAQRSSEAGLSTWPGRAPGAQAVWAQRTLSSSLQGLAAYGLVEPHPPPTQPRSHLPQAPPLAPAGSTPTRPPDVPPPSSQPHGSSSSCPHLQSGDTNATLQPQPHPAESPQSLHPPHLQHAASHGRSATRRLPVSGAAAAAAAVPDACALVERGAVAALAPGLRERVEHLVEQLAQVQQRRSRLLAACEHSVVAGGRRLLLLLLRAMWASMRGAWREVGAPSGALAAAAQPQGRPLRQPALPPSGHGQPQARRPRYRGVLAELVSGLGNEDAHMDTGVELATAAAEVDVRSDADGVSGDLALGGLAHAAEEGTDISGQGSGGTSDSLHGAAVHLGANLGRSGGSSMSDSDMEGFQRPDGLPALPERMSSSQGVVARFATGREDAAAAPVTAGMTAAAGGLLACNAGLSSRLHTGSDLLSVSSAGACRQVACQRERAAQEEQLRLLQAQLSRCGTAQGALQREVDSLLAKLAEARRSQAQGAAALQQELAGWRGEPGALAALGPEELAGLAARLEGSLSRVRAAQLQAAADRELLCPVCWEARKALVFGCGHQTCAGCGERLAACPICRVPVALRIRMYG